MLDGVGFDRKSYADGELTLPYTNSVWFLLHTLKNRHLVRFVGDSGADDVNALHQVVCPII